MNAFVKAFEIHLQQCVVLSAVYWISQCVADMKFEIPFEDEDIVHVFTSHPQFPPKEIEYSSLPRVWIVILGVLGGIVFLVTCFFCYFALRGRPFFRSSRPSNPPPPQFQHPPPSAPPPEERDSWNRRREGPPEYTSVVLGVHRLAVPQQQKAGKVETPPPAYMTVAPFQ